MCETILKDGELTYDELCKLDEWFNEHREACLPWPGDLLVAPLEKAWTDGKVTKTDARRSGWRCSAPNAQRGPPVRNCQSETDKPPSTDNTCPLT